ncbi:MAG TPA: hypothetical protein DCS28_03615 [Candidatus Moranbacteria bacterium]|nr:hypothetical protein [Candidatus Moranbacteria bacterium]HAT75100.1 hypothetical protein [Candidatus Moranbacteria bacterium]
MLCKGILTLAIYLCYTDFMKCKSKKVVKKIKLTESSETAKMTALLENMRDGITLVAEGHSVLVRKLDFMDKKLSERIDSLENTMNQNFKFVFEHFSNIEDETMEIKAEIKEMRKDLRRKVDIDRLIVLEERVTAIEMRQIILRDESKKKYKA